MATLLDDLKYSFKTGGVLTQFIYANVGVFLALTIIRLFGFFFKANTLAAVMPWISANSGWEVMLYKPWTAITYMFVHEGFWHILFNMVLLYFSGRIFADLLGGKRFTAVYFMGGIAGFLVYFISYNVFPVFNGASIPIIGASASIMAILVAIATYNPNLELRLILLGNVKLKYIAIFFVATDILFLDQGGNVGGKLAHIGGALYGFLYSTSLKKGNDWSGLFYTVTDFFRDLVAPKPKMKVASSKPGYKARHYHTESKQEKENQIRIDEILDKISRSGYDSLTKEEKQFLFNNAKK
ncbi:MAG: rhomboid family intramembrane serine protease [Cryomorphaceae bacterium]|nr:rhomboid family intramembrane serine protease [Flavobacteriales bacterium]